MDNTVLKQQDFADAAGTAVTMLVERLSVHAEEWFVVPLSGFLKELCQKQRQAVVRAKRSFPGRTRPTGDQKILLSALG